MMKTQSVVAITNYVSIIILVITVMSSGSSSSSNTVFGFPTKNSSNSTKFILCACKTIPNVLHPEVCTSMLTPYSYALNNSLLRTSRIAVGISQRLTGNLIVTVTSLMKKRSEYNETVKMCKKFIGDARDNIQDCLDQMRKLKGGDLRFKLSNVQTWMSAAITSLGTCEDEANTYVKVKDGANEVDARQFNLVVLNGTSELTSVISTSLSLINAFTDGTWKWSPTRCAGNA